MRLAICLILSISIGVKAQSLSETMVFANQLYADSSLSNAIDTYKRVLFFDSASQYSADVFPKIADCLYKTQKYEESAGYYDLAYFANTDTGMKNEFLLKKVSCFLILNQYQFAEIELLSLDSNLTTKQIHEKLLFNAILHFAKNEFKISELEFKQLSNDSLAVDKLFRKNEKVSKINPKKARIMSMIIPGSGQIYAGDYKSGINSLLLTSGLLFLGVRGSIINSPLDALVSVGPWFQRYYQGGYKKAEGIAKNKILEKRFKIYNNILYTVVTPVN